MSEVCPNCGVVVANAPVCSNCGTDIEKYKTLKAAEREESEQRRAQIRQRVQQDRKSNSQNREFPIVPTVFFVGLLFFTWLLFFYETEPRQASPQQHESSLTSQSDSIKDGKSIDEISSHNGDTLSARVNAAHPPRNPIERARNGTVFIRTSWGTLGSGFIISKDCRVITNRHVVESNDKASANELKASYDALYNTQRASLDLQMKRLQEEYQQLLKEVSSKHIRAIRQQEKIDELQLQINTLASKVRKQLEPSSSSLAASSEFKVSLVDGSEYTISSARYSERFDLATFKLPEKNCPYLTIGSGADLQQGMQLFTIGSPSGLTYSVTSGVFSGFREDEYGRFLQTDAPINPGNSGGPLIMQNGQVVGVNTAILEGTEGIGFSLPIEYVVSEFK